MLTDLNQLYLNILCLTTLIESLSLPFPAPSLDSIKVVLTLKNKTVTLLYETATTLPYSLLKTRKEEWKLQSMILLKGARRQ